MKCDSIFPGRPASRGFTILEALIALVVLAAGILALLSFQSTTMRSNAEAKATAEAIALAEEKLETLRSYLIHDPDGEYDSRLVLGEYSEGGENLSIQGVNAAFQREWEISECEGAGNAANCRHALVTVSWIDRGDESRQVSLRGDISYIDPAKGGMIMAALTGGDGEGGGWHGTGEKSPFSDPELIKELKKEQYGEGNPLPEWWPEGVDTVSFYSLTIYGPIVIEQGNINVDGEIDGEEPPPEFEEISPEIEEVLGDADNVTASCQFIPPPKNGSVGSYECVAVYSSLMEGWNGTITFKAQRQGQAPVYCLPTSAYKDSGAPPHVVKTVDKTRVYERTFENLKVNTYLLISVAGGLTNCPNKEYLSTL